MHVKTTYLLLSNYMSSKNCINEREQECILLWGKCCVKGCKRDKKFVISVFFLIALLVYRRQFCSMRPRG